MDQRLVESVKRHEGWREKAYQDTEGIWTVGYGRNLQELTISKELGTQWLVEDIAEAMGYARGFEEWTKLNTDARRNVFVEMIFNMGPSRVAGFKNMLRAIKEQDWVKASEEMLDSRWARQVGRRADRLAKLMKEGNYAD